MSHFTYCRLTAISLGIFLLNAIAASPATARELVGIVDRSTAQPSAGLNIGLAPIIPQLQNRIALKQERTTNTRQPLGVGVTARVGTLGIGVDVNKSLTPQLNARLGFNFGNVNLNRTDSGIDYDAQLKFSSVQLFGDYYPFTSSSFRVTGGIVAQNNRFALTSKPSSTGTYTIAGTQYSAANVGTLNGEYSYGNSIAPYLGIGIGKSSNEGLGFNADLGVMFTGSPKVSLTASNPAFNNNPLTRSQLDNQARQTENDLRGFNAYPVLSIGLSYGF
ncbi:MULTISPECIES: hypothetical protein [unclassified Chamaesiphon]|uniref:hypothetical protein n=1 Tax=unclassified Chamaesiphon TaxID=2620921 RepID=UPI00286C00CB|nr:MULTISPECIES: hypothetical protein [unclassified Chamaesiphon]